jgi:hypothetical protein
MQGPEAGIGSRSCPEFREVPCLHTPGHVPRKVRHEVAPELASHIGDRQLLLILDNCEHLAEACADLITELLRRCPNLRVLGTSRERLRVDGEAVYAVPPLSIPEEVNVLKAGEITRYDAVTLFLERASRTRKRLSPSVGGWTACRSQLSWSRRQNWRPAY